MWIAETKGEIRQNTMLKTEAATIWCEKISGTRFGQWRYLFVPQPKFEAAMRAGVKSMEKLVASFTTPSRQTQLRLFRFDDDGVRRDAYKRLLPLYSLKGAAGYFGAGEAVEPEAWVEVTGIRGIDNQMFVARAVGRSMEPRIHDGDYLVFRASPVGSR